jgi:hypothetical protein
MDRVRTRQDLRDLIIDLFQDRQELQGRLRERNGRWRDEEEESGEGWRGPVRERIAERIAERRRGGEEGVCYFTTRGLQDEDGDLVIVVRRRVCRDLAWSRYGLLGFDRAWRRCSANITPAMSQSGTTIRRKSSRAGITPLNLFKCGDLG